MLKMVVDGEQAEPLFQAINDAPFSEEFKRSFISEILASPGLRFGGPRVQGFFDGSHITTSEAGGCVVHAVPSGAGKLMIAALRALRDAV